MNFVAVEIFLVGKTKPVSVQSVSVIQQVDQVVKKIAPTMPD